MVKIAVWLLSILLSAAFYRMGGMDRPFRSWMRDWLISPLLYVIIAVFYVPSHFLAYILLITSIILTGGALSTYWDWLFKNVDNFYMHGFMVGLGAFPLFWLGFHWYAILFRAIYLALTFGMLNKVAQHSKYSVWIEELGRGALILFSIIFLTF